MIFLKKYVTLLFQNERVCSGMVFLPKEKPDFCKTTFETAIRNQNLILSDGEMFLSMFQIWTNRSRKEPIKQVFIGKNGLELTEQQFNAKLFAAKIAEHTILNSKTSESHMFYF
jgi:glutamate synthase (ferredoxin)